MDSIFLGAMLSISSTTIIAKSLSDLGKTKERFAQLIFGILIVEDILAIVMIVLLSGIAMTGSLSIGEEARKGADGVPARECLEVLAFVVDMCRDGGHRPDLR